MPSLSRLYPHPGCSCDILDTVLWNMRTETSRVRFRSFYCSAFPTMPLSNSLLCGRMGAKESCTQCYLSNWKLLPSELYFFIYLYSMCMCLCACIHTLHTANILYNMVGSNLQFTIDQELNDNIISQKEALQFDIIG